jgi:hypothetical protein
LEAKPLAAVPASELGTEHKLAFDLAGTVGLPSPFPATARVSLIKSAHHEPASAAMAKPRFFIKIVQCVSHKQLVTAFADPYDVRGVRSYTGSGPLADPSSWTFVNIEDVRTRIKNAIEELTKPTYAAGGAFEIPLYDQAVVYLPEAAPLLQRIEFALVAAVAAENRTSRMCPTEPPWPFAPHPCH